MADFYVNYTSGNDETGDGTSGNPVKHISKMISLLTLPITEDTTIHLAGTIADPQDYYDDDDPTVNIEGIRCVGDTSLIIRPAIWNEQNYNTLNDPFSNNSGSGIFDPKTEDRPCLVPPFMIKQSEGVVVKGLGFFSNSNDKEDMWMMAYAGSRVQVHYCLAKNAKIGFLSTDFSSLEVYNSCTKENDEGMVALMQAKLSLYGDNYFLNCRRVGIRAKSNSAVTLTSWFDKNPNLFTTDIRTTAPRTNYAGVVVSEQSLFKIIDKLFDDGDINPAFLKIINENAFKPESYKGVTLESMSLLVGANSVIFSEKDNNQGTDTVSLENQFFFGDDTSSVVEG